MMPSDPSTERTPAGFWFRTIGLALGGLVAGAILGFMLLVGLIALAPRETFGEMKGVAAIDLGLVAGAPCGALLGCGLGIWAGLRHSARKSPPAPESSSPRPQISSGSEDK